MIKNPPANAGDMALIPDSEDPLEKEMATYSSIPAWKFPWTEEPGRLQSMGSQRVGYDLVTEQQCIPERPRIYYWSSRESFCFVGFAKKVQSRLSRVQQVGA